jgi:uncharacterized membrane protein YgaE (UPF0421/DUF939 family)
VASERRQILTIPAIQLSARCAAAAAISLGVAGLLQMPFPLYAVIAAVIVTDPSAAETRKLALPRIVGTIVGASLGAALSPWLAAGPAAIASGIFTAMALSHALGTPAAAKLAGYVCAICLLQEAASPWTYSWWRFAETMLGIGVAVLASLVPPLLPAPSEHV